MPSIGGLQLQQGRAGSSGPPPPPQPFTPASLYTSGQQGAWYDESTLPSMYQDSAATTPVTALEQFIGRISDRSGRGNNGLQATAGARPVYSSKINILSYTEDLLNAAWIIASCTVTSGAADPLGGTTAFTMTRSVGTSAGFLYQVPGFTAGTPVSPGLYIKRRAGIGSIFLRNGATDTVIPVTNAWTLVTPVGFVSTGGPDFVLSIALALDSVDIWHPQLTTAPVQPYQRVNAPDDYDTSISLPFAGFAGGKSWSAVNGGGGVGNFFFCQAVKLTANAAIQTLFSDDTGSSGTGYRLRINAANKLELAGGVGVPLQAPVVTGVNNNPIGGNLPPSTQYWYVIAATNAAGESVQSNEATAVTPVAISTSSNTISWNAAAGATGYKVYRGSTGSGTESTVQILGNQLSFNDTGAGWGTAGVPLALDSPFVKLASAAAVPIGTTTLVTAWDDGTNFNVQLGDEAVTNMLRPAVLAGAAGFSTGVNNSSASNYFVGSLFPSVYRQLNLTATERADVQTYCKSKAGI